MFIFLGSIERKIFLFFEEIVEKLLFVDKMIVYYDDFEVVKLCILSKIIFCEIR